jgi:hypothetical protein
MGGVVNTVTRSGGNLVHGTGYWFFRNRTLNATDRYANGVNAPEWRHQAGGSLGGPIQRDNLFYFFNFEMVKRNFPALNRIINSQFTDSNGNIPASACTATPTQCANAIDFLRRQQDVIVPRNVNSVMGFGKIDWNASPRNSFNIQLNAMHWRSLHGIQTQAVLTSGNALGNNGNSTVETRYGKIGWTSILSSNVVNELRFGWFKDRLSDPGASDLWPKETGALNITLSGSDIGAGAAYPRTQPSENRYQIVDNYSWVTGAHSAKFGVDFQTTLDWINQLFRGTGAYNYTSLTNFARDFSENPTGLKNYSNFQQAFNNPIRQFRSTDINLYAQDTWKLSRRLTLNYGLRYERSWLPQPTTPNPDYAQTGRVPQDKNNFAPRLSLSYAANDRTVFRAGYGIFYARVHGQLMDTFYLGGSRVQTNIFITPTQAGSPVFPAILSSGTGLPSGSINLQYAADDFHAPYTQQGNLAVERQLTRDLNMTVSYIWSRGVGLIVQNDVNLGPPGPTVTYRINDVNGNQVNTYSTPVWLLSNRVDTRYSKILRVENGGNSWYNGLAVQVNKRMSHGVSAKLSYTWSHAIDDADMQGASWNITSTFNNATVPGNYRFDKGSSSLDTRHRAVINWMWEPKFTNSDSRLARYVVNGWGLSGIVTLASAHPWTPTVNVTSSTQFTGVAMANTTMNGSGGWTRVPFLPVGSLDVDQIKRVDARVERQLPFSERVKGKLMFEAFNIFNMMYNTNISTQAYSATNGVLTPTAGLGAGRASQGFPDGTNARRAQVALRVTF